MNLVQSKSSHTSIALIGNPNSGKSTLFNSLTGLHQKTGNYSGVTVDKHYGSYKHHNVEYQLTDLPGTYSLYPKSIDEEVACKALLSNSEKIDVVVIVVDSSNLKRHLLLATQVIDLKKPCVMALNMIDEAEKNNITIYKEELEKLLGISVIATNSRNKEGIKELKEAILNAKVSDSIFYNFEKQKQLFPQTNSYEQIITSQFNDKHTNNELIKGFELADNIHRFAKINYIVAKCIKQPEQLSKSITQKLDSFFTHKIFGFAFFFLVLLIIFQFIFYVAEYPMTWIEEGFAYLMNLTATSLPQGQFNDLLVNGILAGISGIVVFVPQIALLFFFIAILEDTGYMARASFILDKVMRRFGLNGKSVIPMISSVACAVPSIMSTRTITNWKDRIITILVTPLISCSARLPVYTLLISIMFAGKQTFLGFNYQGLVLMAMYLLGFAAALLAALVLKRFLKTSEKSYFIMELPVYRKPQWQTVAMLVFDKVKVFLFDAGKIILAISVVLWFLTSHAPSNSFDTIETKYNKIIVATNNDSIKTIYEAQMQSEKLEASYAGILGKKMEPVIKPLGFDWKIGIALITSFAAREVFVGTMATIYSSGDSENTETLREKLIAEKNFETQQPSYTNAVCWSLLVFYVFAMQCMSTLATTYRETKHWKWPAIQLVFMTGLAYLSSFFIYSVFS
ncbi:MAG: ferrous iron transport protein B [Sphingobacteriaceae bacterium]|nr:ferrous iron transport protein B [Sphingobacteriaceae bacterium]